MADTVREALEAAAFSIAAKQCDSVMEADQRACIAGGVCRCRNNAATAIAAFLRTRARRAAKDRASMIPIEWMHEAAAAVERAARKDEG